MPPPRSLVGSKSCGFVCQSCLSHLRAQKQPSWNLRTLTLKNGSLQSSAPKPQKAARTEQSSPAVKYFEESPDGDRKELFRQDEAAESGQDLESRIAALESELRKFKKGKVVLPDDMLDGGISAERRSKLMEVGSIKGITGISLP